MSDLIERLRKKKTASHLEATKPGTITMQYKDDPLTTEAADALEATQAEIERLREALEQCKEALRNHACHGGAEAPCMRSKIECDTDCGFDAGNAFIAADKALEPDVREALEQDQ